jgi:hypothetical protein
VQVGETCLDNRFSLATKAQFDALRKAAELDRAAQRIKAAATAQLVELHGAGRLSAEALAFLMDKKGASDLAGLPSFISDIRRKLWIYGSLFDGQVTAVERIISEATAKLNAPAAEAEAKVNAPEGTLTITGTVVKTEWKESDFGSRQVMTVKVTTPEGIYLTWGTVPSAISAERGDVVNFTANFEVSDRDASFSFFKRPRKAAVLVAA